MTSKFLFVLRRRWLLLVTIPVVALMVVFALSPTPKEPPPRYTASTFVAADPLQVGTVQLSQAASDIRQTEIAGRAAELLELDGVDPLRLGQRIKAEVREPSMSIQISTTDRDPDAAEARVEAFADAFLETADGERVKDLENRQEVARERRDQARIDLDSYVRDNAARLVAPADPAAAVQVELLTQALTDAESSYSIVAQETVDPSYRLAGIVPATRIAAAKLQVPQSRAVRSIVTFFFALIGAVVLALLIERINPRIDAPIDAEEIINAPTLGMIPIMKGKRRKIVERADLSLFSGPFAESFRAVRSHLDFRSNAEEIGRPPCVMIVSSAPGEGKTTTAAFLGLSYAEAGRDVLVVGADFRRPAVHRLFGVPRSPGLSTRLLANDPGSRTEEVVRSIVKRDERTGVRVIPSGPGTDRVTGLLGDLAAVTAAGLESDCTVVIDTAPVMVANDAIDFLPLVDWVIVVVRLGKTTERSLRQTIATLELNDATIAGSVIMGSLESADAKRYYYSYYKVDEEDGLAPHETRTEVALAGTPQGPSGTEATPGD